jgi:prepilin-type N-terminal cleavage/methylation domain-containing protein
MRNAVLFRKAFTLIELLVVIAIIALLLSIVTPSLKKARDAARRVVCSSQLSQLGKAFEMYQTNNDYKRFAIRSVVSTHETNVYWMGKIADYIGEGGYGAQYRLGETIEVLMCSSTPAARYMQDPDRSNGSGYWGNAERPYEWLRTATMSTLGGYTINGYMGYDAMYNDDAMKAISYTEYLRTAANVPLFGDGLWTVSWPKGTDAAPRDLYGGRDALGINALYTNQMARFALARHGHTVNLVYRDLHVESVGLEQLWQQPWHRNYQYPAGAITLPAN